MSAKTLVVIAGPTAVGKTAVAVRLAEYFHTAVVSADSRQLYREMNIGTAKPSREERERVPHYFIDSHSITEDYDAATYGEEALEVIGNLFRDTDRVVLCGGSGLYIKAVCEGFDEMPEVPPEIRAQLVAGYETHGVVWLQEKLGEIDPETLRHLDANNPQRLIRALEVKLFSGKSIREFQTRQRRDRDFDIVKIGLTLPREELYARMNARMDKMIADGLFEEARALYPFRDKNALQTVGYQEIFDMLDGLYDREECVRLLKRNTRRYAKRQLTWFRKDEEFVWFSPDDVEGIIRYVEEGRAVPGSTGS